MRTVKTYERLERHIRAWAEGELACLLVVGPPGMGKSHTYEQVLGNRAYHRFGGRTTAFECYCKLHDLLHQPVVFDDVAGMLRKREFVEFMKQFCSIHRYKHVCWQSSTHLLKGRAKDFITASQVLVVLNELPSKNEDLKAVLDRLDAIEFSPTREEIIAKMREIWSDESDVIDRIAALPILPSLRTAEKAMMWRQSKHLDWGQELLAEAGVSEPIQQLASIMRAEPKHEWCRLYVAATGRSVRSYRRDKSVAEQLVACCPNGQTVSPPETRTL